MKKHILKIYDYIFSRIAKFHNNAPIRFFIITTFLLNFFIEAVSRHSVSKAFLYILTHPLIFAFNTSIIFMTISIGFLFKRRNFYIIIVLVLWATLGVVNCILQFFRTTPLSTIDFLIIPSAFTMLPVYLNSFEMILIILWIIAIISGFVIAWRKLPKTKVCFKRTITLILCTVLTVITSTTVSTAIASKNKSFAVLTRAYDEWGFVYCFSRSLIDSGIDKPSEYSKQTVNKALNKISNVPEYTEDIKPNIVVIQLESFFDVSYLKNFTFSKNPVPTFSSLKNTCPSGLLTMPSIGGGTANSEFEVLTGINLDFFGIGEYPYQTILKTTPCDSMARILKDKGYTSTAIHNHTAEFYKRNRVYPNLGFDKFVPVEYMDIKERNKLGWAKDSILLEAIPEAMEVTPGRDFIFTVTMQSHGKYPTDPADDTEKNIYVQMKEYDDSKEDLLCSLEYYVNEIYETDTMIAGLLEYFEDYPEPVAVILYGDHLPALSINDEDLNGIDMYQTEYCIWTNYKQLENTKINLEAYQLSAMIFDELELNSGIFPHITQTMADKENYSNVLKLFAYDILYGKRYSLNADFQAANTQMGILPITVSNVEIREETALIYGERFTEYSVVLVNNKKVNTIYIDSSTLKIDVDDLAHGNCNISVAQINDQHTILGQTDDFYVKGF